MWRCHGKRRAWSSPWGKRQWITPEEARHAAFWGLLAVLLTPWVLFALLWPLSEEISSSTLPGEIWSVDREWWMVFARPPVARVFCGRAAKRHP